MRRFFGNLGYRFQGWMQGRYGNDPLNIFMFIVAVVFFVASLFSGLWSPLSYAYFPAAALLILTILRSYSRNIYKRERELEVFMKFRKKVTGFFKLQKRKVTEGKTHCFYKCPNCKTTIRVPRGKGNIMITCPKCRTQFAKRT